jgi:hypothetical protein
MSDETILAAAVLGQLVATKRDLDRLHRLALDGRMLASADIEAVRETLAGDIDYLCDRLRPGPETDG